MAEEIPDREAVTHIDGSLMFQSSEDRKREEEVAKALEDYFSIPPRQSCKLTHFGQLSPIDWFAARDERVVGLLELKGANHTHTHYDYVWLNVRKWLALSLGSFGMGVPAGMVVKFTDQLRWIPIQNVDAKLCKVAGRRIVKSSSDIEPVITVPISSMKIIKTYPVG